MTTVSIYADLYRYRELFGNLFRRDLQTRYKGSVLGVAWSLVNPLVLMGVYVLIFSTLWKANVGEHYPLYVLGGLTVWLFFSASLTMASRSLVDSAALVKKVRFPRQLVPLSIVATQVVTFAVMLVVVTVVDLIVIPDTRDTFWLALPLSLVIVVLVGGFSLAVACANVVFRDVEHLIASVLLPWFFLTPVLWAPKPAGGRRRVVRVAADRPALGEPDHPPARGAARTALLRADAERVGCRLHVRGRRDRARAGRVGVQPGRRPDRSRAVIRPS